MAVAKIGLTPISPVTIELGTVEIPVFERMTKLPAAPRPTGAGPRDAVVPVVKLHENALASRLPSRSLLSPERVAVKSMLGARLLAAVNVALIPGPYTTLPVTDVLPCLTVKVEAVIERGSISLVKVALILVLMGTPVASAAGFVAVTTGAVVSATVPVVKLQD